MQTRTQHRQRAMSLIEVVIAIGIGAFVLSAAASYVVSISEIWSKRDARYAFYEHADGVTQFLKASFAAAQAIQSESEGTAEDANNPSETESGTRIIWNTLIDGKVSDEPMLYFELKKETPFLTTEDVLPSIEKSVYLHFDDEGLSVLHSSRLEEIIESENDLHRSLISPYVKKIEYINWDSELNNWEIQDEPISTPEDDDSYQVPDFLKLHFEYNDLKIIRLVPLPEQSIHLIVY